MESLESRVRSLADGTRSVSRIVKELAATGETANVQAVSALVKRMGLPLPQGRPVKPLFERVYETRPYEVIWVRQVPGAIGGYGPHCETVATVEAATAKEALAAWAIATHQANPAAPLLRLLSPTVIMLSGVIPARHARDRLVCIPTSTGSNPDRVMRVGLGLATDLDERPVVKAIAQIQPGPRREVTREQQALILSEWAIPGIHSLVLGDRTWWRRCIRIWGGGHAQRHFEWASQPLTQRDWDWFETEVRWRMVADAHERSSPSLSPPTNWQAPAVTLDADPEQWALEQRFPWGDRLDAFRRAYALAVPMAAEDARRKAEREAQRPPRQASVLSDEAFMAMARRQWGVLRKHLSENQIRIIKGRLCSDRLIDPLAVSQVRGAFERLALAPFWQDVVPTPVRIFVDADWERARNLILLADL